MADLSTWVPKLLLTDVANLGGDAVDYEYWNQLWALHRAQGDDTANTLRTLIDEWYNTFWHGTDAASYITNPALYPDGALNVSGQLSELADNLSDLDLRTDALEAAQSLYRLKSVAMVHNTDLTSASRQAADCHPMSAITGLEAALYNITAGEVSAFAHNAIGYRDTADAHPMSAITNLDATLASILSDISALELHSHTVDGITYNESLTLLAKLNNMDAIIGGLSGGTVILDHSDLTGITATDAHPISSITGLQTAIDAKQDAVAGVSATEIGYLDGVTSAIQTQINSKQRTITASTAVPTAQDGVDGDVWIVYG